MLNLCFNAIQAVESRTGERWVKISTRNVPNGIEMGRGGQRAGHRGGDSAAAVPAVSDHEIVWLWTWTCDL